MFRWTECLEIHTLFFGVVFSLVAFVLLALTTFSTPYIRSIYFLSIHSGIKFGAFGYCSKEECTKSLGYDYGPEVIEWMTRTHILFGLASLFVLLSLLMLILSLLRTAAFLHTPVPFRLFAFLACGCGIAAEIFALACWVTARHRFNSAGQEAQYGAGLWLGLVGVMMSMLSACIGGPEYGGRYMYRAERNVAYNV